jgi:HAD superfamily hydrolase (TIGR01484 family)
MDLMNKKSKRNYKGIFLDVDGTLVSNEYNGKVSPRVRNSLLKAKQKIAIGIASGRPLERVTFIFDELGLKKPCIVNGGAQIVNPASREILWERPILPRDLKIITNTIKKLPNKVWIVDNGKEKLFKKETNTFKKPLSFFIPRIEEPKANLLIKKLSRNNTLALTKVVAYHQGCVALHITHAQATKRHALLKAAEILNLNYQDLIGVGDGYNDLPLFLACGLKVALGNAVPGLKKAADYIAPPVEEDGVAHVVEKFILN